MTKSEPCPNKSMVVYCTVTLCSVVLVSKTMRRVYFKWFCFLKNPQNLTFMFLDYAHVVEHCS